MKIDIADRMKYDDDNDDDEDNGDDDDDDDDNDDNDDNDDDAILSFATVTVKVAVIVTPTGITRVICSKG